MWKIHKSREVSFVLFWVFFYNSIFAPTIFGLKKKKKSFSRGGKKKEHVWVREKGGKFEETGSKVKSLYEAF